MHHAEFGQMAIGESRQIGRQVEEQVHVYSQSQVFHHAIVLERELKRERSDLAETCRKVDNVGFPFRKKDRNAALLDILRWRDHHHQQAGAFNSETVAVADGRWRKIGV